jgi:hypothetical protein
VLCALLLTACRAAEPLAGPTATPEVEDAGAGDVRGGPTEGPTVPPEPAASPTGTPAPTPDAGVCEDPLGCYGEPERIGTFDAATIPEASGLAASLANDDVLYLLDDRPGTSFLLAVRTDGSTLARLEVDGMDARDGESLAVGPCGAEDGGSCVYVGDIGDNLRNRGDVVVHRVPEHDLSGDPPTAPLPNDRVRLRYPDGAHDAEALLVDDLGRVHIVTKASFDRESGRTGDARLYRAGSFADGVLEDLGAIPVPEPARPLQSTFVGNVVTGGEHRDGRVLLRTYDQVLEYVGPTEAAGRDLAGLASWEVREVPSAGEPQSEAITWAADGCGYLTAGEMVGDLWLVPCLP